VLSAQESTSPTPLLKGEESLINKTQIPSPLRERGKGEGINTQGYIVT